MDVARSLVGRLRALGLLAAFGAVAAVAWLRFHRPPTSLDLVSRCEARLGLRNYSARLGPPFQYQRRSVTRGTRLPVAADAIELERVVQTSTRATPEERRAVADAMLMMGRPQDALAVLEADVDRDRSPAAWIDLAAVHLALAEQRSDVVHALDALVAADRGSKAEPGNAAASYNRALALQRLGLSDEAASEWRNCARLENGAPAEEALRNATDLESSVDSGASLDSQVRALQKASDGGDDAAVDRAVTRDSRLARRGGETIFLEHWAEAAVSGNEAAATESLRVARRIGQSLRRTSGESLLLDATKTIDVAAGDRQRLLDVARAVSLNVKARKSLNAHRAGDAEQDFRNAAALFAETECPLQWLATESVGSALCSQQHFTEADKVLERVAARNPAADGYYGMAAQLGWDRGLIFLTSGRFSLAWNAFDDARAQFERLHETEGVATMESCLADTADVAGDPEEAWTHRARALSLLARTRDGAARRGAIIDSAAAACVMRHEWPRAISLLNVAITSALRSHDAVRAASALSERSVAFAELGELTSARTDALEAARWTRSIPDENIRDATAAKVTIAELRSTQQNPHTAAVALAVPIDQLTRSGRVFDTVEPLIAQARAFRQAGEYDSAAADVSLAAERLDAARSTLTTLEARARMSANQEAVAVEGVAVGLAAARPEFAFNAAERWRGRALLDRLENVDEKIAVSAEPLDVKQITSALSVNSAVVEYARVPGRLVAFVVRSSGVVARSWVNTDARPAADPDLAFIRPIADLLDGVTVVAFVPAPGMRLPLASLHDGAGELITSRHDVVVAPSATIAVRCSEAARQRPGSRLLAVSGDAFEPQPDLQPLSNTVREARDVARKYRDAVVLEGAGSTVQRFATTAPAAAVIHFAGHSIEAHAATGAALLVASDGITGTLPAAAIAKWQLRQTRLVFLSSCRAAAPGSRGDGVENVALAFLVAGVPTVVAAEWDVDDTAAASLAAEFHHTYAAGGDAAAALRTAYARMKQVAPGDRTAMSVYGGLPQLVRAAGTSAPAIQSYEARKR
jgi:tetratricopeptide (TPR) repeat protein